MEPTIQQWISMRGPEGYSHVVKYDGATRRTTPHQVQPQGWAEDDLVDLEDEVPVKALQAQCRT
eukprot:11277817-Prorocentrum_lima.AAC.1